MKKTILLTALLAISLNALACDAKKLSQIEWRDCEIVKSQKEQDFIFEQVYLKLLVLSDQMPADAFKKAQDDWEKFKRSSCYFALVLNNPDEQMGCLIAFNKSRAKSLKALLKSL